LDLLQLYLLNLVVTVGMFIVLIIRAWIEYKHFKNMWDEMEWTRTRETVDKILRTEKDLFSKTDRGRELYDLLCQIFRVSEDE